MDIENTFKAYKQVEADKLFLKNLMIVAAMKDVKGQMPMVLPHNADLIRIRQIYLKSYKFTKASEKTLSQKTKKFLIKEKNYLKNKIEMLVSLLSSAVGPMMI